MQISAFKRLYDGDLQLQVLNQMEPDYWKPTPSSGEKKRTSQVFTPSSKKNDKRATAPPPMPTISFDTNNMANSNGSTANTAINVNG